MVLVWCLWYVDGKAGGPRSEDNCNNQQGRNCPNSADNRDKVPGNLRYRKFRIVSQRDVMARRTGLALAILAQLEEDVQSSRKGKWQ